MSEGQSGNWVRLELQGIKTVNLICGLGQVFFFFFFSTSDSVSSLPCRVCAASSALTLYGDRCFTERSFSIPGFCPNSLWRVGRGREPWERSEAGGVNDTTPAPLTGLESHGGASEGIKGGVTTLEDERGPGLDFTLCFVCGSRPWGAAAFHLCLFILLKCV